MAVGGIKGGGKGGRAGGAKGAGSSTAARAAESATGAKVDSSESLTGPSEMAGSGNVGLSEPDEAALAARMKAIAQQFQRGEIPDREKAVQLLVAEVLQQKLRVQSKVLTERITKALLGDQRQGSRIDGLLSKG